MELGEIDAKLLRLAADLVQSHETIIHVECGVLDALGHDRPTALLELHDKANVRISLVRSHLVRQAQQQDSAQKIKDWFFNGRIAAPGGQNCS